MSRNTQYAIGLCVLAVIACAVVVWRTLATDPSKPTVTVPAGKTPLTTPPLEQEGGPAPNPKIPTNMVR